MNLRFIESFVLTAALGSFSKAAEVLCVTQAAVAARVAKLEQELGVLLFERDGSALRLSAQGRRALPAARELVQQGRDFSARLRGPASGPNTLRIGWTDFISHLALRPLGEVLLRRHPQLSVEIQSLSSLDVMDQFVQGRLDLAICVGGPQAHRDWVDRSPLALPLRWVCSPTLFARARPTSLAALAARPIVTYPVGTSPYVSTLEELRALGIERPSLYSVSTVEEMTQLTCLGAGSALVPPVVVLAQLQSGQLIELAVDPPVQRMEFHAVYREHGQGALCREICELVQSCACLD